MEFLCKLCGQRKGAAQGWLVGFERPGQPGTDIQNTIILLCRWDEQRAGEWDAVHFCSMACQDRYLSKNYGDDRLAA